MEELLSTIAMVVLLGLALWLLLIRPAAKQQKMQLEMVNEISGGERVLLTSGMFATVNHVGERQLIVELAPQVEVTILKSNVARIVGDDEEEFDLVDDVESDDVESDGTDSDGADSDGVESDSATTESASEPDEQNPNGPQAR